MNDPARAAERRQPSAFSPLRQRVFRAFWLANLTSLVGTWIHSVGAAWHMTELARDPLLVALVPAATTLPVILLALPAGALADVLDRRRLLLFAQSWMLVVAATLGLITLAGWTGPASLLGCTLLLGVGAAINAPVWQAVLPELVDDDQLPAAVALGSTSFNLARAIGPGLGGWLVAAAGPGAAFLVNAASFLGVLLVVSRWRPGAPARRLPPEDVVSALFSGLRYVRHAPGLLAVMARGASFMIFASALFALLPVVAQGELSLGAREYGLLLSVMGFGAVLGVLLLARFRERGSTEGLVAAATLGLALACALVALLHELWQVCAALFLGGLCWLVLMSSFNTSVQVLVPSWVRGRAVSVYLVLWATGNSVGSALWGAVAGETTAPTAMLAAAAGIALTLLAAPFLRLPRGRPTGLAPALHWPAPVVAEEPAPDEGPVVVNVEYRVAAARTAEFIAAAHALRAVRLRTGGHGWRLLEDLGDPTRFVEQWRLDSWGADLRQHARLSEADRALEERALACHEGPEPPRVRHLLARRPGDRAG